MYKYYQPNGKDLKDQYGDCTTILGIVDISRYMDIMKKGKGEKHESIKFR